MNRLLLALMSIFIVLLALAGAGCDCGDDDDDDNDSGGPDDDDTADDDDTSDDDDDNTTDDDDDATDQPPVIENTTEHADIEDTTGPYTIETEVSDETGIDEVVLYYQINGGGYTDVTMATAKAGTTYTADISGQAAGSHIEYYIQATDSAQQVSTDPATAPADAYGFYILQKSDLIYDDGTSELSTGPAGLSSGYFLRVTPDAYPAYLTSILYYFRDVSGVGEVQPYVIYAEEKTETPPDITTGFTVAPAFVPDTFNTFMEVDVSMAPELATPLLSGDFYIGYRNTVYNIGNDSVYYGWDTGTMYDDRSWGWFLDSGEWFDYAAWGTLMFRATVLTP